MKRHEHGGLANAPVEDDLVLSWERFEEASANEAQVDQPQSIHGVRLVA